MSLDEQKTIGGLRLPQAALWLSSVTNFERRPGGL